jgi:hypothetical protein
MVSKGKGGGIRSKTLPPSIITPDQLPGLRVWYKMDAQPGLSNGDPVTTIVDSSGNGLDLTFDLGGNYNNYANYVATDAKFNGKPSVNGKFIFKRNLSGSGLDNGSQPFAMYAVVHKTEAEWTAGPNSLHGFAFGWGQNGTRGSVAFVYADYVGPGGGFYVDMVNAGAGGIGPSPRDVTYILAYSYNGGSEDQYPFYVNNDGPRYEVDDGASLNLQFGEIMLGGKPAYGWSWLGSIAEAIAFADYHDETKMNQVRNYLNNKYQAY